jgi:hypothetical protein
MLRVIRDGTNKRLRRPGRLTPNVPLGEDGFYGMGLTGQKTADVQWCHHGGDLWQRELGLPLQAANSCVKY